MLPVGPVEEERGGVDRLSRHCVTVSGLRLAQLAALIAGSDLYLGNDSGVSHLAAAVSVRTVALFGPSDIEQWSPRGTRVYDCTTSCLLFTLRNSRDEKLSAPLLSDSAGAR